MILLIDGNKEEKKERKKGRKEKEGIYFCNHQGKVGIQAGILSTKVPY